MGYRVTFYRQVLGVSFRVPYGVVEIRSARDLGRAIAAAKIKFARRLGIANWRNRADVVDVERAYEFKEATDCRKRG